MYQKRYKILKLYLSNFKTKYYLREISKLSKLSLRTTQRTLDNLEKENIIKTKKEGKNRYYFLNMQNTKTKFHLLITEINKTLTFLEKFPVFNSFLKERIESCLIVFGSFAKFTPTETSDLDILIIGNEPSFYLLPYKVHKIKLNKKQFEKAMSKNEPLIKEIMKNHVILTEHSYFLEKLWDYYEKT